MNWADLEKTWRAQLPDFTPPAWSPAEFEAQRRAFARRVAWRDWSEIGTCVLVAAVFAAVLRVTEALDWRGWLAIALVLAVGAKLVGERRRAARMRPPVDSPLLVQLEAEIAGLRHQAGLLRSVAVWYLAPLLTAIGLVFWALVARIAASGARVDVAPLVTIGAASLAVAVWVWWLNRHTVRTRLEPQIAAYERARDELHRG